MLWLITYSNLVYSTCMMLPAIIWLLVLFIYSSACPSIQLSMYIYLLTYLWPVYLLSIHSLIFLSNGNFFLKRCFQKALLIVQLWWGIGKNIATLILVMLEGSMAIGKHKSSDTGAWTACLKHCEKQEWLKKSEWGHGNTCWCSGCVWPSEDWRSFNTFSVWDGGRLSILNMK